MGNHIAVCDLMAENGRLTRENEALRKALVAEIARSRDSAPTWGEVARFLGSGHSDEEAAEVYFTRKTYFEIGQRLRAALSLKDSAS